jgi:hypothetical protein
MTEKRKQKPKPPTSVAEAISRLDDQVAQRKRIQAESILQLLSQVRSLPFGLEDVHRLARVVQSGDPSWQVALQVVEATAVQPQGSIGRALCAQLTREARHAGGYPDDVGPSELEATVRAWCSAQPSEVSVSPQSMLGALWPERNAPWFPDVTLRLLEKWTSWDPSIRSSAAFGRALVQLLAGGCTGQKAAESLLLLLQPVRNIVARFNEERKQFEAEIGIAQDSVEPLRRELSASSDALAQARAALVDEQHRTAQLTEELSRARNDSLARQQALNQQHANELGRLRNKVLRTLERETEEIRLYLEDATPHVAEALERLGYIERLHHELGESV